MIFFSSIYFPLFLGNKGVLEWGRAIQGQIFKKYIFFMLDRKGIFAMLMFIAAKAPTEARHRQRKRKLRLLQSYYFDKQISI